jgi:hypothetical protein
VTPLQELQALGREAEARVTEFRRNLQLQAYACLDRLAARQQRNNMATKNRHGQLKDEITAAINRYCAENGSDTPDFILAQYLMDCLGAFDAAVVARERWYGREKQPAGGTGAVPEPEVATAV